MAVLNRLLALIAKEFAAVMNDPKSRMVVIGPPIIQFFLFGYAATFDLKDVPYAVLDESHTAESRALLSELTGSANFDLVDFLSSEREIDALIDTERIRFAIHLGPTFAEDLHAGRPAPVQVILDGRNSNVASIAMGYIGQIVAQFNGEHQNFMGGGPGPRAPGVMLEARAWYNPNLESRWFIVSGLGGTISMLIVILLTSLSVAREREQGTFDQLLVSPFTSVEILAGKAAPALFFGMIDALLLALAGIFWFGIPFTGDVFALVAGLAVFMLAISGVGLFISSLCTTMQQALLGSFIFVMPGIMLSGFATPIESMPHWLQVLTLGNPLRYILVILRRIFLEGAGFPEIAAQLPPMALIAVITLPSALWLFRHRSQ